MTSKTSIRETVKVVPTANFQFINPMLAASHGEHFIDNPNYASELKFDGRRAIIQRIGDSIQIWGRSGVDWTRQFPEVVNEIRNLESRDIILDGELVTWKTNAEGYPMDNFNASGRSHMLNASKIAADVTKNPTVFQAFDILRLDGTWLMDKDYLTRKALLEGSIQPNLVHIQYVPHHIENKRLFYGEIAKRGHEGIILKQLNSPYRPGTRGPYWWKIKARKSEEAVIIGYTKGLGSRSSKFGAVVLGQFDSSGKLVYVGKAGSGFEDKDLNDIFPKLKPSVKPIMKLMPAGITWVEPVLVAEIEFQEKTSAGVFRMPVFKGLRDDKTPAECTFDQDTRTMQPPAPAAVKKSVPALAGGATQKNCGLCGAPAVHGNLCEKHHSAFAKTFSGQSVIIPAPVEVKKVKKLPQVKKPVVGEESAEDIMKKYGY